MSLTANQIPLYLNAQHLYQLDNFYFKHTELKQALLNLVIVSGFNFLYLWGSSASGKSHLLLATAQKYKPMALYLPLADLLNTASPDILQPIPGLKLMCIDQLDYIVGKADWEEALFHCFNQLQYSGCKLLIAARQNPASIAMTLPDLRSRMATALVYHLHELDDDGKRRALITQARAKGLQLTDDVAYYLLRYYSRDMGTLMTILHKLDRELMITKRRLTLPFIRQALTDITFD